MLNKIHTRITPIRARNTPKVYILVSKIAILDEGVRLSTSEFGGCKLIYAPSKKIIILFFHTRIPPVKGLRASPDKV